MTYIEIARSLEGEYGFALFVGEDEPDVMDEDTENGLFTDAYSEWISFGLEWLHRMGPGCVIVFGQG